MDPVGKDACQLPIVPGPCEGYYPRFGYNHETKACEQFVYGGCLGNNNRFDDSGPYDIECLLDPSPTTQKYTLFFCFKPSHKKCGCQNFVPQLLGALILGRFMSRYLLVQSRSRCNKFLHLIWITLLRSCSVSYKCHWIPI